MPPMAGSAFISVCNLAGKWPGSAAALRKVKAALGVQLAHALDRGHGLVCRASEHFVDVLADGFAFRLHLYCSRSVDRLHMNDPVA